MIFLGSKFCPLCGTRVDRVEAGESGMACPRCDGAALSFVTLGTLEVAECGKCDGLWVDKAAFEELCANREQQASVLGDAAQIPPTPLETKVRYLKCPLCRELMQRHNFASCSGVVVDVCRMHGTWFDANELQRIMAFIRGGGIDRAREQQKRELDQARRRLEAERARATGERQDYTYSTFNPMSHSHVAGIIAEALWSLGRFP
jgi:Zn-finger nucleic acid-binding protein